MILRYSLIWFLLALIAIGNGLLREFTFGKYVSEITAHQISTLTGIFFTGVIVWIITRFWPIATQTQAWVIGTIWVVQTVCFEFLFGYYVAGHSWERLLNDYNVFQGRIWLLFLLCIWVMPYIFYKHNSSGT